MTSGSQLMFLRSSTTAARIIVPDNTRNAVTKSNYYEPVLNSAYWNFAQHYGVAVIPARVRRPQDKSPVEGSIGWLEVWLLEWLRDQTFDSFLELNAAVHERLPQLSERPFEKRPGSRRHIFLEIDKPLLRPLPAIPYEIAEFITCRVPKNDHVPYDGFHYSVPFRLYKQKVVLRVTSSTIEILDENLCRVALHERHYTGSTYITDIHHMPPNHQHQQEANGFKGANYREWAKTFGENTYTVINQLLNAQAAEEQAYRSCMGLLQMGKSVGEERLEAACGKALAMHSPTYSTVKKILKNHQESVPVLEMPMTTPLHENLRGNVWE